MYYTKINQFLIDRDAFLENRGRLCDLIKSAIYQTDPGVFEFLNFEDDRAFSDPTLFNYFLSEDNASRKISLMQSLFGYLSAEKRPEYLEVKSDRDGLVNLPNIGYLRMRPTVEKKIAAGQLEGKVIKNFFVPGSKIRLCIHGTSLLQNNRKIRLREPPEYTLTRNLSPVTDAARFLQDTLPDLWDLIESVTREFVIFNTGDYNSFAGIAHHGTAYFNTEGKQLSPVFFIDDIAHQCGYIIFNVLTLDTGKYLNVAKNEPLARFTGDHNDQREVYSAFRGLFTYTTILHALDAVAKRRGLFGNRGHHEALGRIGFYIRKFHHDLRLLDNPALLSEEGMYYHEQFVGCYQYILEEYADQIFRFNYQNQAYTFQYELFRQVNIL